MANNPGLVNGWFCRAIWHLLFLLCLEILHRLRNMKVQLTGSETVSFRLVPNPLLGSWVTARLFGVVRQSVSLGRTDFSPLYLRLLLFTRSFHPRAVLPRCFFRQAILGSHLYRPPTHLASSGRLASAFSSRRCFREYEDVTVFSDSATVLSLLLSRPKRTRRPSVRRQRLSLSPE